MYLPLPPSAKISKALGLKRYYTGQKCKFGHTDYRYTCHYRCAECARIDAKKAAPSRQKRIMADPELREAERERCRKKSRARTEKQRAHLNKVAREKYKSDPSFRERNNASCKAWRQKYPHKNTSKAMQYAASKDKRTPRWADLVKIDRVYSFARLAQAATGAEHHVDHVIPLRGAAVSGLHVENNLQVVPWWENLEKGNKLFADG